MNLTSMTRALRARQPSDASTRTSGAYEGSRFSDVWSRVASDVYDALPDRVVELRHVLRGATLRGIYNAARRSVREDADLLPYFEKLVHPVGICLRGTWRITEANPYSGFFRAGSEGLLIARASDNMGENRPGHLRFLGIAGKLYPTRDPQHAQLLRPANFVLNENLIGSHTKHFVDATLVSDLLPFFYHGDLATKHIIGALVAALFASADRVTHISQSLRRQLYPIAYLGQQPSEPVRSPAVMRFVSMPENRRVDTYELREELLMKHHPQGIRYAIEVADKQTYFRRQPFTRIGVVHFEASVASCSCDHRLHFKHAPYRSDQP